MTISLRISVRGGGDFRHLSVDTISAVGWGPRDYVSASLCTEGSSRSPGPRCASRHPTRWKLHVSGTPLRSFWCSLSFILRFRFSFRTHALSSMVSGNLLPLPSAQFRPINSVRMELGTTGVGQTASASINLLILPVNKVFCMLNSPTLVPGPPTPHSRTIQIHLGPCPQPVPLATYAIPFVFFHTVNCAGQKFFVCPIRPPPPTLHAYTIQIHLGDEVRVPLSLFLHARRATG